MISQKEHKFTHIKKLFLERIYRCICFVALFLYIIIENIVKDINGDVVVLYLTSFAEVDKVLGCISQIIDKIKNDHCM